MNSKWLFSQLKALFFSLVTCFQLPHLLSEGLILITDSHEV